MVRILFITMQPFLCLFFGKGVFCQSMMCQIMLCLLQGSFPDGDTAEDGYHGVAPVTAFPPQNNYGTQAYITKHYKQDRVLHMLNMTRYDVLSQDCMICWVMFGSGRLPVLLRLRSCMSCVERHGLTQLMDQPITGHVSPPGQFQLPLIKCSSNILFFLHFIYFLCTFIDTLHHCGLFLLLPWLYVQNGKHARFSVGQFGFSLCFRHQDQKTEQEQRKN